MGKKKSRTVRGGELRGRRPDWRPLLKFAPDEVPEFMWMYRVELEDGSVIEAYKHSGTRQYLHLDASGRGYELLGGGSYREVDPRALFRKATEPFESSAIIVRQNESVSGEGINWARSATRHRIPRTRTQFAIQQAGICFEDRTVRTDEPKVYFFGDAKDGQRLEVVAVERTDGGLFVIHSMPLRVRFEGRYREAMRWRK
jgi:hypothetical protein